jgi:hypothetical protein
VESPNIILSEAKLQRSPEGFRGEASFQSWISFSDLNKPEMFESLASCFAFRCSAALNLTTVFTG